MQPAFLIMVHLTTLLSSIMMSAGPESSINVKTKGAVKQVNGLISPT